MASWRPFKVPMGLDLWPKSIPPTADAEIERIKADISTAAEAAAGHWTLESFDAKDDKITYTLGTATGLSWTTTMPAVTFTGIPVRRYTAAASRPHTHGSCDECSRRVSELLAAGMTPTIEFSAWLRDQHSLALRGTFPTTEPVEPGREDDDVSKQTDWNLIQRALEVDAVRTAYFWGPPGIGKTYSAYHQGRLNRGLFAVTLTEETPAAELRGHFIPRGGEMVWMDGPVITAMRQGGRLVINEVTHASPDAWSFMLPILEGFGTARLTLPNGETVSPAEGFHVICTDNADPDSLPPALKDRFDVTVHVTTPHPSALAMLPEAWRVPATKMASIEEARRVSLRSWMALAKLIPVLGVADAAKAVFGPSRSTQILEALMLRAGRTATLTDIQVEVEGLGVLAETAGAVRS